MRKTLFLMSIMVFASASLAFANVLPNKQAARGLADQIMAKASSGDLSGAFDLMKPYASVSQEEIESAALQSKSQMDQYGARYGSPIGYEFIDSQTAGKSLWRLRYIEKCVKGPLTWTYYFYKNKQGWILTSCGTPSSSAIECRSFSLRPTISRRSLATRT